MCMLEGVDGVGLAWLSWLDKRGQTLSALMGRPERALAKRGDRIHQSVEV